MRSAHPRRRVVCGLAGAACISASACGANNADVPAGLIDAIKHPDIPDSGTAYPPPPYGGQVNQTAQNLCFDGWMNPKAAGFDPAKFTQICLSDYYDPKGTQTKLLLIESCAVWCVACRVEYEGSGNRPSLSDQLAKRQSQGFRVMGTMFQDIGGNPAAPSDAVTWAKTYDLTFPFALDPSPKHLLSTVLNGPPSSAPYNVLIDTRTMTIIDEVTGDEPAILFQAVDNFLQQNAGP